MALKTKDELKAIFVTGHIVKQQDMVDLIDSLDETIQLRVSGGYIQWKYITAVVWTNLIAVADLKGDPGNNGREIEIQNSGINIEWRYVGDPTWNTIIALAALKGDPGNNGREIEIQNSGINIEWRYVGDPAWTTIIALAALKGDPGNNIELRVDGGWIQWRVVGDLVWINLFSLGITDTFQTNDTPPRTVTVVNGIITSIVE